MPRASREFRIYALLVAFLQASHRDADRILQSSGLTAAQFYILHRLSAHGPSAQRDLAESMHVTQGNISQLVQKLEQRHLLLRRGTGRSKNVSLTKTGHELVATLQPEHDAFLRSRFAVLDVAKQRMLLSLLEDLVPGGQDAST